MGELPYPGGGQVLQAYPCHGTGCTCGKEELSYGEVPVYLDDSPRGGPLHVQGQGWQQGYWRI